MDLSWQVIYNSDYSAWYISKVFLTLICAINVIGSPPTLPTGHNVSPEASSQEQTCGNVCLYEEHFHRALCNKRGLTYVPSSTGCETATLLELQQNNIQNIPPVRMAEYHYVRTLDISWNQISALDPGTFFGLNRLQNIICSHNNLEIVPNGVFNGTEESLLRIYLNNNNISRIWNKAFQGLAKVTEIHLNDNRIKALPPGLFAGLKSIQEVLLSNNLLITIPEPQILGLHPSGEILNLTNNHINHTAVVFPFLVNATWTLYLNGNPFLCDCHFQMLQEWQRTAPTQQRIDISSETPLSCEFNNGTKHSITDNLPNLCHDIITEDRDTDIWSDISGSTTLQPVTSNQHRPLSSCETNRPGWLSIFTFIELTLFFILWLGKTFYKPCKKFRKSKESLDC